MDMCKKHKVIIECRVYMDLKKQIYDEYDMRMVIGLLPVYINSFLRTQCFCILYQPSIYFQSSHLSEGVGVQCD